MIGKTRHVEDPMAEPLSSPSHAFEQGCGALRHSPPPGYYRHTRHAPPDELSHWVEHFWLEAWQFRDGASQTREVLPYPSVHLVFAPGRSRIYGVQLGRFVRNLKDHGRILGIKFRPGAFYPFLRKPVCSIANSSILATQVFSNARDTERAVLGCRDDQGMVETAARFLAANLPPRDPNVDTARNAVEVVAADRNVTRVQHLVARLGVTERTLQRLFRRYVGASPRWVIKRYRVYEALVQLTEGRPMELASLAQNLGYFDQSHFTNDFKKLVGRAPTEYADP
jgi:AraC-like DNA-binding protein